MGAFMKHYRQLWLGTLGATLFVPQMVLADISGTVFRDFNANGLKDNTATFNEIGIAGVTVKAFDTTGAEKANTTSGTNGTYALTGLTSGTNYRVEFSWSQSWLQSGASGGTTVQFFQDGATNVNAAFNAIGEYSTPTNPRLLVATHRAGSGVGSNDPGIHSFLRSSTGLNADFQDIDGNQGTGPIPGNDALIGQVGSVWGLAWQANKKRAFAASFLKRHVGLKDGLGYVYVLDESTSPGTVVGSFNLQGVSPANGGSAIDLGSVCRDVTCAGTGGRTGIAADYVLPAAKTSPSIDLDAFYKIGKVGFGDADVQPGTEMLWLVNANQKALIRVDASSNNVASLGSPATVNQYVITSLPGAPTCTGGELRPWALTFSEGKGYLGVTCDAFTSRQQADLKSVVVSFDPNNISAGFTEILSLPLNYKRTIAYFPFYPWMNQADVDTGWIMKDATGAVAYPQPLLSDIEFDDTGNLYLAIMDLFVHQTGQSNYKPISNTGDGKLITGMTTGDFLKACKNGSNFVMEGGAGCAVNIANGTGPHLAGQFFEDYAGDGRGESVNGAIAYLHGTNQIDAVTMDPHPDGVIGDPAGRPYMWTQGTSSYNLATGKPANWYGMNATPDASFFGKGNGLGDIELLTDPAPIEIGNRVWLDTDNDGLQDAGENGIPNVQVQLLSGATVVATATTAADGTYYFTNAAGTDTTSKKFGLTQLQPNTAYTVKFPTTVTVSGTAYNLTTATAGGNTLIDSNAPTSGEVTVAAADIPTAGANNHSFDVGYSSAPACSINTPVVTATCNNNGTPSNPADDKFTYKITATGSNAGATYSITGGDTYANRSYGTEHTSTNSFPISGGNLALTLTDDTTASCKLNNVAVTAPATCSGSTPSVDLEVTKTANVSSAKSGDTVIYTIKVKNNGPDTATGVEVTDHLPAGVTYASHNAGQGIYTSGTGLWTVGTLANGASATLTISVTIK